MSIEAEHLVAEAAWARARLDVDYNARATVGERFADEMRQYRQTSEHVRKDFLSQGDIVYDPTSGQTLDIFGTDPSGALRPVFVFIHGGYWRALSKDDSSMMAGMLAKEGIATAVVDYQLVPGATLAEIVRQIRSALAFLWHQGRNHGIDPEKIHIGGSSAGGHLVGMALVDGWHAGFGVPDAVVKSALPISGLFDLAPIAASFVQEWMSLDEDAVHSLSPIRHLPPAGCPIAVVWAEHEAPGFKRQSTAFATAWSEAGFAVSTLEVCDRNHFDILMELQKKDTDLARTLLALIKNTVG
ncbi:alpha/beta hydrolase [Rhizobium sp.]|jgi:arylformamidase|uniref:alpha/beta hydrolase n=1 Tax=Rhizobium sp. TaxID=391 RepID=UPI000E9BBA0E|nr:alpha/beta hydrolase [Rhizobium sp.]